MKVFIALLCVAAAAADPMWYNNGFNGFYPSVYHMPMIKPVEFKAEEYTKTQEYKTGMPTMYTTGLWNTAAYPYHKFTEMPKVETDYAAKGEYRAESAGGIVHVAKRSADPLWYNNWNTAAFPYQYSGYAAHPMTYSAPVAGLWNNYYPYHKLAEMPKVETDYASKGEYRAESAGGIVHVAKRSADPLWYNNWNNAAFPYHAQYSTYAAPTMTYAAPTMTYAAPHWPYMGYPIMPKMVANDRTKVDTPDYASKGEYVAESAGVVHMAKREADPLVYLRSSGIIPRTIPYTGINTLPYSGINTLPYSGFNTLPYNNFYNNRYISSAFPNQYYL